MHSENLQTDHKEQLNKSQIQQILISLATPVMYGAKSNEVNGPVSFLYNYYIKAIKLPTELHQEHQHVLSRNSVHCQLYKCRQNLWVCEMGRGRDTSVVVIVV
jgi:hypothetical protein